MPHPDVLVCPRWLFLNEATRVATIDLFLSVKVKRETSRFPWLFFFFFYIYMTWKQQLRSSNIRRLVLEFSRWHLQRAVRPSLTIDGPAARARGRRAEKKFHGAPHVPRSTHQRCGWRCLFQLSEQRETLSPTARSAFYLRNTAQNNPRVVPDVNRVALHGVFSVACRAVFFPSF